MCELPRGAEWGLVQSRTQSPQVFWSAGRRQERLWDNGISYPRKRQSRTQSPQAFWSAGRRWDNGISYPRKRGIPVFVRMLTIKAEVKCPKVTVIGPEGFIGP